ncbi:MAG: hypothetical protein JNG84_03355 [Archangium sp.]|nr:hypothetical protein [Archangium sp.]
MTRILAVTMLAATACGVQPGSFDDDVATSRSALAEGRSCSDKENSFHNNCGGTASCSKAETDTPTLYQLTCTCDGVSHSTTCTEVSVRDNPDVPFFNPPPSSGCHGSGIYQLCLAPPGGPSRRFPTQDLPEPE